MIATLFSICNSLALAGWAALVLLPRWRWTARVTVGIALALSVVYLVLAVVAFPWEGGFGSIEEVATLFRDDRLLLAGWVHYLAFDLLLGTLESRRAREAGMPHWMLVPCLLLTFLVGPIGLLLFFIVKSAWQRRIEEVVA